MLTQRNSPPRVCCSVRSLFFIKPFAFIDSPRELIRVSYRNLRKLNHYLLAQLIKEKLLAHDFNELSVAVLGLTYTPEVYAELLWKVINRFSYAMRHNDHHESGQECGGGAITNDILKFRKVVKFECSFEISQLFIIL